MTSFKKLSILELNPETSKKVTKLAKHYAIAGSNLAANILSCLYHYEFIFNRKFESYPPEVFWLILNSVEMKNKLSTGLLGRVLLKNGIGGTEFGTSLIVTLSQSDIEYRGKNPHALVLMDHLSGVFKLTSNWPALSQSDRCEYCSQSEGVHLKTRLRLNEDDIEEKYIKQNGNIFEWLAHQAKSGVASAKMNLVGVSNCGTAALLQHAFL